MNLRFLISVQNAESGEWMRLPHAFPAPSKDLAEIAVQRALSVSRDMVRTDGMTTATGPTIREMVADTAMDIYERQGLEPQYMAFRLVVDGVASDADQAALMVLRRYA